MSDRFNVTAAEPEIKLQHSLGVYRVTASHSIMAETATSYKHQARAYTAGTSTLRGKRSAITLANRLAPTVYISDCDVSASGIN
jgi:hypothetical protein